MKKQSMSPKVLALSFLTALCASCGGSPENSSSVQMTSQGGGEVSYQESSSAEQGDPEIREIYALYLQNGGTMTYEEWLSSIKGEKGDKGDKGEKGEPGQNGQDGSSILTGRGQPSANVGSVGDSYIDLDTFDYYIRSSAGWSKQGNLKGNQGQQGEKGEPGQNGKDGVNGKDGQNGQNGQDGQDGVDGQTPYIGQNGNWWIGDVDTGVKAQGQQGEPGQNGKDGRNGQDGQNGQNGVDGLTPYIGQNGNWWIGNTDTGVKAQGQQGEPGQNGQDGSDGLTPFIGGNGNWWIGDTDTGVKAQGRQGEPGQNGQDGQNGSDGLTPFIGYNGNWWIGDTDTGVKAQGRQGEPGQNGQDGQNGSDGLTPFIGYNGNWWIGNQDTGVRAQGQQGEPGQNGKDGTDGQDGNDGQNGKSAYEIYKEAHPEYQGDEAQWLDDLINGRLANRQTFTVSFDAGNGQIIPSQTIQDGKTAEKPTDPTRDGYVFLGWYDEYDEKWSFNGDVVTKDIVLHAKWQGALYALSVISEDINKGNVHVVSGVGFGGEDIVVKASPESGYAFKGWFEGDEKLSEKPIYTFTMPDENYSIVAKFWTENEENEWKKSMGMTPSLSNNGKTVTYGLYPQTHVNDNNLIASLNALPEPESNGWYLLDGKYYAKKAVTPDKYSDSASYFDGSAIIQDSVDWFFCEPIEWKILENNGGEAYVVSIFLLDAYRYNEYYNGEIDGCYANNYKGSEIRQWLNHDFFDSAFSLDNSSVLTTTVDNSGPTTDFNPNPYACENTQDKVFLPSYKDYLDESYGFLNDTSKSDSRKCMPNDWAMANGAWQSNRYGSYYTRSPDSYSFNGVWKVGNNGDISTVDGGSNNSGVRPAIRLKIDEDGSSGQEESIAYKFRVEGNSIYYGLYPQSIVSDRKTLSLLNNGAASAKPNGWYLLNGEYYVQKTAIPFMDNSYRYSDGSSVLRGNVDWFHCEPIEWKILSESDGEALVVSDVLLDVHRYNEDYEGLKDGHYANNYKESEIRQWLNEDFYGSAFLLDDTHVLTTTVDNSAPTTNIDSNPYTCENTQDKVFLLSYQDYLNESYGFSSDKGEGPSRKCRVTDWALASGINQYYGYGSYYTRSPNSDYSYKAWDSLTGGLINDDYVSFSDYGVRPGLRLKIA